jgi:hypothetical protein
VLAVNLGKHPYYTLTLFYFYSCGRPDTGSSDLWVVSETCRTGSCAGATVQRYSPVSSGAKSTSVGVEMRYGDSKTGTFAKGNVGFDIATIAGVSVTDQAFGIINDTTNVVVKYNTAGIFGLGFPTARSAASISQSDSP